MGCSSNRSKRSNDSCKCKHDSHSCKSKCHSNSCKCKKDKFRRCCFICFHCDRKHQ